MRASETISRSSGLHNKAVVSDKHNLCQDPGQLRRTCPSVSKVSVEDDDHGKECRPKHPYKLGLLSTLI